MSRRIRYIPEGGSLVEVTSRTVQGRFLMRPSRACRTIILGILARAQRLYPVEIHGFAFLSNHYHLLLTVPDAESLARFMQYLNSNIAREIGRLVNWNDAFWSRRYQLVLVSEEEAAQIARLRYVLGQASKEGLVDSPTKWPGAHCAKALLTGSSPSGLWFDRTKEFAARVRSEHFSPNDFATEEVVELTPLPCWRHLDPQVVRSYVEEMLEFITREARKTHGVFLGIREILRVSPHDRPARFAKSPVPLAHCASKRVRREFWNAYHWFLASYRDAAEALRRGNRAAEFPTGCFPPALPYAAPP